jgi:hypothetical protein
VTAKKISVYEVGSPEHRREKWQKRRAKAETDPNYFLSQLWSNAKVNTPKRSLEFSLDPIDMGFLIEFQDWKCAFSGRPFSLETGSPDRPSMDRIDNNLGYVASNLHFVTVEVNYMKGEMSYADFVARSKEIAKNCNLDQHRVVC